MKMHKKYMLLRRLDDLLHLQPMNNDPVQHSVFDLPEKHYRFGGDQ